MTVADLIAELQRHAPHKEVRVRPCSVWDVCPNCRQSAEPREVILNDEDATRADLVRDEGPFVQIVGR